MNKNIKQIQMSKPCLDEFEIDAVRKVFETGYLGMGNCVEEFEQMLSGFFNRQAVCVSTGTSALHLSLEAAGVTESDEVLVQSMTYTATYQAITAVGAIPVSCDVCEDDISIDLNDAKSKITSKTKAIIPVHYSGYAGKMGELMKFAEDNGIRVIEDAAHAFGSKWNDKLVGSAGDITCFSFDPVKTITCGEGGAIVTDDNEIIKRVRKTRVLGIEKDRGNISAAAGPAFDKVNGPGWRCHMSNINAAIGISQFKKFYILKEKRQTLAKRYTQNLRSFNSVELLPYDYDQVVPYIYVIKLKDRFNYEIINELSKYGIQAGYHYYPCHLQDYFKSLYSSISGTEFRFTTLPVSERIYRKLLTLPMHPELEFSDVDYITECLKKILN